VARPPKRDYRPLMVDAAKRRLLAGDEVRMTDIAAELEVSGPLVHYYFRDRQELVDAAWREILADHVADDHATMVANTEDADWDGVRALIERVFAPHRDASHLAHLRAAVEAGNSEALATVLAETHDATISRWRALMEQAQADGVIDTALDTQAVATLVVGISLGVAAVRPRLEPNERRALAEAWATLLRSALDPDFAPPRSNGGAPDR
jgi:AcrR family transcriptional regulator